MFRRPDYKHFSTGGLATKAMLALVSKVAPGLATLIMNIAIGRLGGSVMLGLTQNIVSTASLSSLIYPSSAGVAASRYLASEGSQATGDGASAVASYLARQTLFITMSLAIITAAVLALSEGYSHVTLFVSALMVIAVSGRAFTEGLHYGSGEGLRLANWSIFVAIGGTGGALCLLLLGVHNAWVLAPLALLNILFSVSSWPKRASKVRSKPLRREIHLFILLSVVGTFASSGFSQAAVLVGRFMNDLSYSGQYAAAFTLVTPIMLIASGLSSVLFPALAASHKSEEIKGIRQNLASLTSAIATVMICVFIPLSALSGLVVSSIWGPEFHLTPIILIILLPAVILSGIVVPSISAITSASNKGMAFSAASSLSGAVLGIITWILLGSSAPQVAVPIGYSIGTITIALIPYFLAWRHFRMSWARDFLLILSILFITTSLSLLSALEVIEMSISIVGSAILLVAWIVLRWRDMREMLHHTLRLLTRSR